MRIRTASLLLTGCLIFASVAGAAPPDDAKTDEPADDAEMETLAVTARKSVTATSTLTVPAESFELRPLESGGQMLEAVPNLVTAQHTGGGKAEQYFIRGFDADHGTDLGVYFDGVPINLRSHAHGQGYLDLHFVTKETIARLDAYKGPYFARYGDFSTAATVEYVPFDALDESFVKFEGGSFETIRAVAGLTNGGGVLATEGPAQGFLTFEAYHTDGPFSNDEDLWRYSALARGSVEASPDITLSGHLLGYYGEWNASGLVPRRLVESGDLDRFGSLDPSEGGHTARVQGKVQLDWTPSLNGHFMANAYVAWYDLELFSNFTYNLENPPPGSDGIVQRDQDRVYTGGRVEYAHDFPEWFQLLTRVGAEWRFDDANVELATQTERVWTGCQREGATDPDAPCNLDHIKEASLEPYVDLQMRPAPWITVDLGLRFSWFHFAGRDGVADTQRPASDELLWLPKANVVLAPFVDGGLGLSDVAVLADLEVFGNFGIGYHSNDARAVFTDPTATTLPRATGTEVGFRTQIVDGLEIALDYWWLWLEDEFLFVGDEGTTEAAGPARRQGIEFVTQWWIQDWLYLRGDVAYTSARLEDEDVPIPQAPRFVATGSTGVRYKGFAAELSVRHLGDRYASDAFYEPKLPGYTVLDLGGSYRWRNFEIGAAIENLTNTDWSSSEFYYDSCTPEEAEAPGGCAGGTGDRHFAPGNPINARVWVTARF